MLQGGRPPAQTCRDGVPDELEQVRGEVRWDFTEERAFLMKGQGEKRKLAAEGQETHCWAGLGCQRKWDGKHWEHS